MEKEIESQKNIAISPPKKTQTICLNKAEL